MVCSECRAKFFADPKALKIEPTKPGPTPDIRGGGDSKGNGAKPKPKTVGASAVSNLPSNDYLRRKQRSAG